MSVTSRNAVLSSAAAICVSMMTGCGGGGGGTGAPGGGGAPVLPAAPAANLAITTKLLQFSWTAVPGATSYRLMRNADGMSGFTQVGGSLAAGATSASLEVPVHLIDWLNARYHIDACNAAGCTPSADLSSMSGYLQAAGYFKASNPGNGDNFGRTVALSRDGNTLAVGAPHEDSAAQTIGGDQADNTANASGAVYVFARSGNSQWIQQAYVKAANGETNDSFGYTLALSGDGNTLLVSAPGEDSFATGVNGNGLDNTAGQAGAAYVFTRNAGTWSQQSYLKASNAEADDYFGYDVAVSADGNTVAVGAPGEDSSADGIDGQQLSNSAAQAGAVYLFSRSGGAWTQQAYVKSSFSGGTHMFGHDLRLSAAGDVLLVGATGEGSGATGVNGVQTNNNRPESGAAYVFRATNGVWSQEAYLKASRALTGIEFGGAVALSGDGNTIAVGARLEDSGATGIDGNQDDTAATSAGAVYVFAHAGGAWAQQGYLKASNTDAHDLFGSALALNDDGSTLAVGAVQEASQTTGINGNQLDNSAIDSGAAYVFARNGSAWTQRSYLKPNYVTATDYFGYSLSLSGDGNTLAVGLFDDSAASGVNGNANDDSLAGSGAVYLY